jgi:hypothetical protein
MTLYLLGLTICKIVGRARTLKASWGVAEPGQKWRFPHWAWEHTTEFRGGGVQLPLLTKIDAVCRTLQVRTPWAAVLTDSHLLAVGTPSLALEHPIMQLSGGWWAVMSRQILTCTLVKYVEIKDP